MRNANCLARSSLLLMFFIPLFMISGCKPRLLPGTNVKTTQENKEIIKFLEQYKAAVEKRTVGAIMELIAKDFSDNQGSELPALKLDYLGLKEKLEKSLPRVQDVRLGLFVQHVAKIDKLLYEVVVYFNKHSLMEVPAGEKWVSVKEVSRMVIRKRTDKNSPYQFEIIQGI